MVSRIFCPVSFELRGCVALRLKMECTPASFWLTLHGHEQTFCDDPGCRNCGGDSRAKVDARFAALTALWVRMVRLRLENEQEGGRG